MKAAYRFIAQAITALVVVQAATAALFGFLVISDVEAGVTIDSAYRNLGANLHAIGGLGLIPLLSLALLVVSFQTKVKGASKLAGTVLGIVVVQVILAIMSFSFAYVSLLHAVNAFVLIGATVAATRRMTVKADAAARV